MKKKNEEIIEYRYLPMKIAFENEELRTKAEQLLGERLQSIQNAPSTFEQFMILGSREEISKEDCEMLKCYMQEQDCKDPYPFYKMYPELLEECGCIWMQDISYTKVYAVWINGQSFAIEKIRWEDEKQLFFYPWEAIKGVPWSEKDGEVVLNVATKTSIQRWKAWKQILLTGEVDVRKILF